MKDERRLSDLVSIGPAMLRDFELLGIRTVAELARRSPEKLTHNSARALASRWTSAAWTCSALLWPRRATRGCPPRSASGGTGPASARRRKTQMDADERRWSKLIHNSSDLDSRLPEINQEADLQTCGLQVVHALGEMHFL